jgi:hypothetical protein
MRIGGTAVGSATMAATAAIARIAGTIDRIVAAHLNK